MEIDPRFDDASRLLQVIDHFDLWDMAIVFLSSCNGTGFVEYLEMEMGMWFLYVTHLARFFFSFPFFSPFSFTPFLALFF